MTHEIYQSYRAKLPSLQLSSMTTVTRISLGLMPSFPLTID